MSAITRSSLRQQIADALRDEVLTGRLPGGRDFTVKQIAELYGVSATPVREALVDLTAQGLLEVEHYRGFRVRSVTFDDFRAMVEARILVTEGMFHRIGAKGMKAMPVDILASVRRRAGAAARAARAGELDVLIGCDLRFWGEVTALAGNQHICEFLERLRTQTWIYSAPYLRGRSNACWADHMSLVDAVCEGDTEAAQRIVEEYNSHSLALMRGLAGPRP